MSGSGALDSYGKRQVSTDGKKVTYTLKDVVLNDFSGVLYMQLNANTGYMFLSNLTFNALIGSQ